MEGDITGTLSLIGLKGTPTSHHQQQPQSSPLSSVGLSPEGMFRREGIPNMKAPCFWKWTGVYFLVRKKPMNLSPLPVAAPPSSPTTSTCEPVPILSDPPTHQELCPTMWHLFPCRKFRFLQCLKVSSMSEQLNYCQGCSQKLFSIFSEGMGAPS